MVNVERRSRVAATEFSPTRRVGKEVLVQDEPQSGGRVSLNLSALAGLMHAQLRRPTAAPWAVI